MHVEFGDYEWKSYKDCYEASESVAKYLVHHQLCPEQHFDDGNFKFISIFAKNREEWTITDLGASMTNITVVTLYDTLGKDSIDYILNVCKIRTVVVSADKIRTLLDLQKEGRLAHLKNLIVFDVASPADEELAASLNVKLIPYTTVIAEGKTLNTTSLTKPTADDVYTLSFTSGTTGQPKGVMITQRNITANVGGLDSFDG
jgi:long-chain acyl-CoA synthetase